MSEQAKYPDSYTEHIHVRALDLLMGMVVTSDVCLFCNAPANQDDDYCTACRTLLDAEERAA